MASEFVVLGHDIEKKGFDIVVQRLRTEEELGQEAEILAVERIASTVDFEE